MKRFAVFSAIIGKYDAMLQPSVVDDRFDYILFSDSLPEGEQGVWKVRRIDYSNSIKTKVARYVKAHPEALLPEYDASLWLDANIRITGKEIYDRFVELFENKTLVASVRHLAYDCVYNEMFAVLDFRFESEEVIVKWGHELRKRGFPRHAGLYETGLLYRRHSNEAVRIFDALWWKYIETYSKRDQLSFTVALREENLSCGFFLPEGKTVRDSEGLVFVKHKNEVTKFDPNEKPAWLMHHYYKHHEDREKVFNLYYWIYGRCCPMFWAKVIGQYYRIVDKLR
jgi:hypothetical protein